MKLFTLILLILGMSLNVALDFRQSNVYQVISSHPHDLRDIAPYITTVQKTGRLWTVKLKKKAPESVLKHLQLISGREKSYFHLPSIFSMDLQLRSASTIMNILEQINRENIHDEVVRLAAYDSRAVGTKGNQDAVSSVQNKLSLLGYEVKRICYATNACSVVADKKGSMFPDQVLMVMAHVDSVGEQFAGADDNASGTAVLLEMARVLKDYDNKKTLRFFITNGEENGMLGAAHYSRLLANQGTIKQLDFVINMDMVGYNSNGIVELETNPEFESQAKWYADMAYRFTTLKPKITLGAWGSDHVPFLRRGVTSILTIENWDTKTPCYHAECDTPETINYDYAAEIGRLNVAAILNKDII